MYQLIRLENDFVTIKEKGLSLPQNMQPASPYKSSCKLWQECPESQMLAWNEFVRNGVVSSAPVRKPIVESWERCQKAEVDPVGGKCWDLLSERELQKRKNQIVEVSQPIIDTLYECIRGSYSVIVLIDNDGCILRTVGDLSTLRAAQKLNFGPGANWSETSVGTNAIGTALAFGAPIQVTGSEHYCESHHLWTCSAAPIRNTAGKIVACLDISGPRENSHPYTLGMIVTARF
jgi:transcriptional regulator of acetoin/glycerol metabolism